MSHHASRRPPAPRWDESVGSWLLALSATAVFGWGFWPLIRSADVNSTLGMLTGGLHGALWAPAFLWASRLGLHAARRAGVQPERSHGHQFTAELFMLVIGSVVFGALFIGTLLILVKATRPWVDHRPRFTSGYVLGILVGFALTMPVYRRRLARDA